MISLTTFSAVAHTSEMNNDSLYYRCILLAYKDSIDPGVKAEEVGLLQVLPEKVKGLEDCSIYTLAEEKKTIEA